MTLRDLREKVAALSHLHPLADVQGVESVAVDGGTVLIDFDDSEAEIERDEAREDYTRETERANEAERVRDALRDELKAANDLLDEVKDQGRGPTLLKYREQAEQADLRAAGWKKAYDGMDAELSALRKRKGMLAALYANKGDIIALLRDAQTGRPIDATKAKDLCQKINSESK